MAKILTTEEYAAEAADVAPGELTDDMARTIASWWHSPGSMGGQILQLSQGTPFVAENVIDDIDQTLAWAERQGQNTAEELDQLRALRKWVSGLYVTSVWSSHGHTFMGADGGVSCLTCGAHYFVQYDDPDDYHHGAYVTWNGDEASECTGDTSMSHGQDDMHRLDAHRGDDGTCTHCDHECNCVICTG